MTTFLTSFLVFLGVAAALALSQHRDRSTSGRCGGCSVRERAPCGPDGRSRTEAD